MGTHTVRETAAHLRISIWAVYRQIRAGKLTAVKVAGRWAITLPAATPTLADTITAYRASYGDFAGGAATRAQLANHLAADLINHLKYEHRCRMLLSNKHNMRTAMELKGHTAVLDRAASTHPQELAA
jgi:hypothetical protein